jgi:hypothetical protein
VIVAIVEMILTPLDHGVPLTIGYQQMGPLLGGDGDGHCILLWSDACSGGHKVVQLGHDKIVLVQPLILCVPTNRHYSSKTRDRGDALRSRPGLRPAVPTRWRRHSCSVIANFPPMAFCRNMGSAALLGTLMRGSPR